MVATVYHLVMVKLGPENGRRREIDAGSSLILDIRLSYSLLQ
jgi:hypothetical protein